MKIVVYENFSKKINSTKQPSGGTEITEVRLKENCSLENPVFILRKGYSLSINYVYAFNSYYYVNDLISLTNELIELHCVKDVLATYKNEILNTNAYVIYSQSSYNNMILDKRIPTTSEVETQHTTVTPASLFSKTGCYRVSVNGGGSSQFYYLSEQGLSRLANSISNITDQAILDSLIYKFGSPFGAVNGCVFIPFEIPSETVSGIWLGDYQTDVAGFVTDSFCRKVSTSFNIPWVNDDKARRVTERLFLYLPGVGEVTLDTSQLWEYTSLGVECYYDYINGNISYNVYTLNHDYNFYYTTSLGTPIEFGIATKTLTGAVVNSAYEGLKIVSKVTMGLLGGSTVLANSIIGDTLGQFVSGMVEPAINAVGSTFSTIGSLGSYADGNRAVDNHNIIITCVSFKFSNTQESMASVYGRPLNAVRKLSTLKGFCQCANASVEIAGNLADSGLINASINSGFFIE